ncbi:MAG TPA: glutamine-hydrolyzing carbamoyl-phosphate synthase small subunit, partial [Candidatus Omnitrophota bacterium]|nr:glutamine-hydrolyzing carbamoyl-phosphate synthase small subunit [Candidatus Omnitrophota bacterium]
KAVLSTEDLDEKRLLRKVKSSQGLVGIDLVREVTIDKKYDWKDKNDSKYKIAVLDCGVKYNILRSLDRRGCKVIVFPAKTSSDEILKHKPDGLLLSNGPGDPAAVSYVIETTRSLLGKLPIFGICLGHQILGLALGGKTYKLKFGHHGSNHPVKDLRTGKVYITAQNHGFCVDIKTLKKDVEITHLNLNDKTLEGMRHKRIPAFSVQFHPEASPGPHEAEYLFDEFIEMIKR